ncbi:MAG: 1-phosphofructokinase [Armatimonadota bacterium]
MIATVTLNPALDKSIYLEKLHPNDTNRILKVETDAGGKGINVSRVLRELGSETLATGFLGGRTGGFIEHVLSSEGIPSDFVHTRAETRTNIAVQEASGAPPTTLNAPGPAITDAELAELFERARAAAKSASIVVFGGSVTEGVPKDVYQKLVAEVRAAGALPVLDSDGEPMKLGLQSHPFMIKPNRDEVARLTGIEIACDADAVRAAKALSAQAEIVVISLGARGAVALTSDGAWKAVPPDVAVVSTVGSGDSMVAGILSVLERGGPMDEALALGSAAGAATAMTDGTGICKREQVLALLGGVKVERL